MNTKSERAEAAVDHLKGLSKIRIADEAMLMQDAQELLAMERAKARAHSKKFLGDDYEEGEVGNIHVGDVNHAPQLPAPSAPSSFGRKAIAAGLLALSGGGVGAGAMALYEYLASQPPPAAESFEDTDTNTEYEMKLIPGEGTGW